MLFDAALSRRACTKNHSVGRLSPSCKGEALHHYICFIHQFCFATRTLLECWHHEPFQMWLPSTTFLFLLAVAAFAAWKLFSAISSFLQRRADDLTGSGKSSGGGGDGGSGSSQTASDGGGSLVDVLQTRSSSAFIALLALLACSVLPAALFACLSFRRRSQRVQPSQANAPL